MVFGTPRTKGSNVLDRINAVLRETTHYLPREDWNVRQLLHLAEDLVQADPPTGHSAIAAVYQLTGDIDAVRHHSANAIKLAPGEPILSRNYATHLANLGFFSEAQEEFVRIANPERGMMSATWPIGYRSGAFCTMARYLAKARTMELELNGIDVQTAEQAAELLARVDVTDASVAAVLDQVGQVMRDNKLFFVGEGPAVSVWNDPGCSPFIEYVFQFEVPSPDAQRLYLDFIDAMTKSVPAMPDVLSVLFRAWNREHERSAA